MPHPTRKAIAIWTVTAALIVVALVIGVVIYTFSVQENPPNHPGYFAEPAPISDS